MKLALPVAAAAAALTFAAPALASRDHQLTAHDRNTIRAAAARSVFPPHHYLWLCIHRYEGAWNNHGPYHYGGLQMTWNWLGYVRGDAGAMSQADQEWAAERAWAASGYSYSFLYGQWYEWDAADGCGTTG